MLHRNAKLTPAGRRLLVDRIASGRPVAHVAAEMGVARQTAHRWWRRFVAEGESGLQDRSCRPRRSPRRTPRALERRIERLRRRQKLGPVRIGYRLGLAASTVYRVLCRLGLQRLSWLDRPTGRVIRRYEHPHPGDLLHMDIKKLGRIPPGGGWRAHGRGRAGARQRVGYAYIHSAVDDHSRLAYSEVLADERAVTVVAFWRRALAWFADRGVTAQAVLTDNGSAYRSADFARACLAAGIRHRRTRPYRPQTNGKVERFNRTLLEGMGLRSRLPLRAGTHGRARALAAPLQSPPRSHRPRRSTSAQPCHQPPGTVQLASRVRAGAAIFDQGVEVGSVIPELSAGCEVAADLPVLRPAPHRLSADAEHPRRLAGGDPLPVGVFQFVLADLGCRCHRVSLWLTDQAGFPTSASPGDWAKTGQLLSVDPTQ